jgi:arginine-tRNA-protein transferase
MALVDPPELVVHDEPHPCHYLPGRQARLPLRFPIRVLRPPELDRRLEQGDRRQGLMLYRTQCAACVACEPIRVDVPAFRPDKTQRRVVRACEAALSVGVVRPGFAPDKLALYERHKLGRGLQAGEGPLDPAVYKAFFVDTCCDTVEIDIRDRVDGRLVAMALADRGERSLSAVYCFWDPRDARLSPGAYAILVQIELCRRWDLRWLYLGLYVEQCRAMSYKARWVPHERLVGGAWRRVERCPRAQRDGAPRTPVC